MMARHHQSSSPGLSNGHPRGNTFDISPHRFQPRASTPASRRRKNFLTRLGIVAAITALFGFFVWPGKATITSIFSFGLVNLEEEDPMNTVRYYDLGNVEGTARGWEREERILVCVPLRDAEQHMPMMFSHFRNFTYPHHLIDLAFLVSDSKDRTLEVLIHNLEELQAHEDPKQPYGEISIIEKDFGQQVNQDVESRHGFAAQAGRRKLMAQARNWLLSAALRPYHSWVYWRDVDVETAPFTILEDLMRHNKDVIVPNVWRPLPDWLGGEQPYDLNSWQESETALALADTLDEDAVIVEGYAEYATWRPHLAYLRDPYGDPDMEMEIDGVGGVSILSKARVFRSGVHFPAFSFEKHAETEGFGKEMEQERLAKEAEERQRTEREKKIKDAFDDTNSQWAKDKSEMQNIAKEANKVAPDSKISNADSKDASSKEKSNAGSNAGSDTDSNVGSNAGSNAGSKDPKQKGLAEA
ncbi:Mannan polymerase II complex anp1 subunit [Eutypa lata]|nr:Mannan polymerase II complex anp1 subunit [Eutypa lata]